MTKTETSALMEITSRPSIVFTEGHGSWLTDSAGNRYLDFIQGWAVNCLGHSPKPIVDALARQAARLINCSPAFFNEPMARLASLLRRAIFTSSWMVRIERPVFADTSSAKDATVASLVVFPPPLFPGAPPCFVSG